MVYYIVLTDFGLEVSDSTGNMILLDERVSTNRTVDDLISELKSSVNAGKTIRKDE